MYVATHNRYVLTLCDGNICAAQNIYVPNFDGLGQKIDRLDPGSTVSTQTRYVSSNSTQVVYVSTMLDRGRTVRPSLIEEKRFD